MLGWVPLLKAAIFLRVLLLGVAYRASLQILPGPAFAIGLMHAGGLRQEPRKLPLPRVHCNGSKSSLFGTRALSLPSRLIPMTRGCTVSSVEALRIFRSCGKTSCLYSSMRSFILKL